MSGPRIYNLFPPLVGPIAAWHAHLERIAAMRFDWIYLNPFHAPGFSGSLYAVKDYEAVNPLFAGDEDGIAALERFCADAESRGIGVMMDLVVNHTAKDALLVEQHPDWYVRDEQGQVVSPFAIDPGDPSQKTVWGDLAELDYRERPERAQMIAFFEDVVRRYAARGFRGFRCDAAYKVPGDVWAPIIAAARDARPDVLFVAETLGAPLEAIEQLRPAGFDYLFNSSKWWDFRAPWLLEQYEAFRHIAPSIAFPESHDTPRLEGDEREHRFAYAFAASFSAGVMLPIGYEYGFTRAVNVVETRPSDWETPRFDISSFIAEMNACKAALPALNEDGPQRVLETGTAAVALLRRTERGDDVALVVVNPDPNAAQTIDLSTLARDAGVTLRDVTPERAPLELTGRAEIAPRTVRLFASAERGVARDPRTDLRPCILENVWPEIDAGRYPVKRVTGETLVVEADCFREGHDALAAVLRWRAPNAPRWNETAMEPIGNDRWRAAFRCDRLGRYTYTVVAWPDTFASWRNDTCKKREAGQPIGLELIEGRAIVEAALARATGEDRERLAEAVAALPEDESARAEAMLAPSFAALVARAPERERATTYPRTLEVTVDAPIAAFAAWYELFPRSESATPGAHGTFADVQRLLPDIAAMGFDVLYFPPIHPIGSTFRKGRNNALTAGDGDPGSPYAIGSAAGGHTAVEPQLGTLADFERLTAAARAHGLEIALDYALQASPDHPWIREHPEWFTFRPDGTIKYAENPPKKYQDIVNFNFDGPHAPALWDALRDVILFWTDRGVRIFRVDNPHTKPFAFWEWMIGDVQRRRPGTIFLAEAFTRPKVMHALAKLGFTQSYTYFTWRNTKAELTEYARELSTPPSVEYYRPNFFANTPDILPAFLQTGGVAAFRIRLVLAATLSPLYGIYKGFEYGENTALHEGGEEYRDSEKYEFRRRDPSRAILREDVVAINTIRRENAAFATLASLRFHDSGDDRVLFYSKHAADHTVFVAVTLDPHARRTARLRLPLAELGGPLDARDLTTGATERWTQAAREITFDPARAIAAIWRVERPLAQAAPVAAAVSSPYAGGS